jgi:hypothetical protein
MTQDELLSRLVALPARDRMLVRRVALEGRSLPELAREYGVEEAAASWMVFRAFQGLGTESDGPERLVREWGGAQGEGGLSRLRGVREVALARLVSAEKARAASPWRVVEEWLRWLGIVAIIGLSAWFWMQDRAPAAGRARTDRPAAPR